MEAENQDSFREFVATIAALRAPDGCPWDREQTHQSIARNMIEEAYEAVDAIEHNDIAHMREELGDVLLQVVLQSQIAADASEFTIDDVCRDVNAKIIRRHPHVFGDAAAAAGNSDGAVAAGGAGGADGAAAATGVAVVEGTSVTTSSSADEVLKLWDQIKLAEKEDRADGSADAQPEGLLDGVPTSFPALMQAYKISRKAVSAGFEWDSVDDVWRKVEEECAELKEAAASGNKQAMEYELGDVLFSLVNVGRKLGVDAETALRESCNKFRERWAFMEGAAWGQGRQIQDLSMDELQNLWDLSKQVTP